MRFVITWRRFSFQIAVRIPSLESINDRLAGQPDQIVSLERASRILDEFAGSLKNAAFRIVFMTIHEKLYDFFIRRHMINGIEGLRFDCFRIHLNAPR